MHRGFNYVVEKLTMAVFSLAIGTGNQQDRLHGAFLSFHTLDAEDFPEGDLREAWESIDSRLTELDEPPPGALGCVRYTLNQMSDADAMDLAKDIVELCFACRREETDREVKEASVRKR